MEEKQFNRYYLFKNARDELQHNIFFESLDNKEQLIRIYEGSYLMLSNIENLLYMKENNINDEMFYGIIDDNIFDALNYIDVNYIKEQVHSKSSKGIKDKILSMNISLQELQNNVIEEHVNNIKDTLINKKDELYSLPKVFLSYSYRDLGLSFALFLYCLSNRVFLYVDWMWNTDKLNGKETKMIIEEELRTSSQLLFTLTPASELNAHGYHTIRQWCAWEIGNYYTKNIDEKYYVNFYPKHTTNMFIDTLKPLKGIKDRKLY